MTFSSSEAQETPTAAPLSLPMETVFDLEAEGYLETVEAGSFRFVITEAGRLAAERERILDKIKAIELSQATDEELEASLSPEMRSCLLAAVRWGRLRQVSGWGLSGRFQPMEDGLVNSAHSSSRGTVQALADRGLLQMEAGDEDAVPTERGDRIARSWNDPLLNPGERHWTVIPGGRS